jgi:hypothetical protein
VVQPGVGFHAHGALVSLRREQSQGGERCTHGRRAPAAAAAIAGLHLALTCPSARGAQQGPRRSFLISCDTLRESLDRRAASERARRSFAARWPMAACVQSPTGCRCCWNEGKVGEPPIDQHSTTGTRPVGISYARRGATFFSHMYNLGTCSHTAATLLCTCLTRFGAHVVNTGTTHVS